MRDRVFQVGILVASATMLAGCRFDGVNSLPLPGNSVSGDTYSITIELADVQNLVGNSPVKAANATVGSITGISSLGWNAAVTVRIAAAAELPSNVTAKLAQTSVLGSQYIELIVPEGEEPAGRLQDGDVISLDRTSQYPPTEEVLSALSLVLNGSGLQQIQTVTTELNNVLGGREQSLRSLIDNLDEFVSGLDDQRADIIAAIDGLDRLSDELVAENDTLGQGIDTLAPAIGIVEQHEELLTTMLDKLGEFGDAGTQVLVDSRGDLNANVESLLPVLTQLGQVADQLPEALKIVATLPFPVETADRALRGDYMNLFLTLDLNPSTIRDKVLGSIPLGAQVDAARQATDPLLAPALLDAGGPRIPSLDEVLQSLQEGVR